jgi:hypothetical protein
MAPLPTNVVSESLVHMHPKALELRKRLHERKTSLLQEMGKKAIADSKREAHWKRVVLKEDGHTSALVSSSSVSQMQSVQRTNQQMEITKDIKYGHLLFL